MADTELHSKSPAELHALGIALLGKSLDSTDPTERYSGAALSTSLFFASLSADNLATAERQAEKLQAKQAAGQDQALGERVRSG